MKIPFGVGGAIAGSLLAGSFLTFVPVSIAEPLDRNAAEETPRKTESNPAAPVSETAKTIEANKKATGETTVTPVTDDTPPPLTFAATAYSLYGRTASGANVKKGIIAADRRILPIGTKVKVESGNYTGEYEVCDTGGAIKGKHIDVWVPSTREANRFGRRSVKLTVLSYPKGATPKGIKPRAASKPTAH